MSEPKAVSGPSELIQILLEAMRTGSNNIALDMAGVGVMPTDRAEREAYVHARSRSELEKGVLQSHDIIIEMLKALAAGEAIHAKLVEAAMALGYASGADFADAAQAALRKRDAADVN